MSYLYIRTLKQAENTVFCVHEKQKVYYHPLFGRFLPYSSGQQVKRSILDTLNLLLDSPGSPTTFVWEINDQNEFKEGEAYGTCDPSYPDQLLGGWMLASKWSKEKPLKRRSPLSISPMRPLHPSLARVHRELMTLNRSRRPNNTIIIRNNKGDMLSEKQAQSLLTEKRLNAARKFIPENVRAAGIFVQDIAIDLRRLFSISLNPYEPEISKDTEKKLRQGGWKEGRNVYGPCLVAPRALREECIALLADAVIDWRITSNQSTNFHLMETLALTVCANANRSGDSIRARQLADGKAEIVVEGSLPGVETFVTLASEACFFSNMASADALDRARAKIVELLSGFDYEKQRIRKK